MPSSLRANVRNPETRCADRAASPDLDGPQGAAKAAAAAGANMKVTMESGKTVVTHSIPGVAGAIARATLTKGTNDEVPCANDCAERVEVRQGNVVTDCSLQLRRLQRTAQQDRRPGIQATSSRNGMSVTILDLTIVETETGNPYVVDAGAAERPEGRRPLNGPRRSRRRRSVSRSRRWLRETRPHTLWFGGTFHESAIVQRPRRLRSGSCGAVPAKAHHAVQAQHDFDKPIEFRGPIVKVEFVNPHSMLYIEVTNNDGSKTVWKFQSGAIGIAAQPRTSQEVVGGRPQARRRGHRDGVRGAKRQPDGVHETADDAGWARDRHVVRRSERATEECADENLRPGNRAGVCRGTGGRCGGTESAGGRLRPRPRTCPTASLT